VVPTSFPEGSSSVLHPNENPHLVIDGSWPGVTQVEEPGVSLQCVACEYAGCICVVIVVPMITVATADSSSTEEKTIIVFIMIVFIFKLEQYLGIT
jgi:hypothetical protein